MKIQHLVLSCLFMLTFCFSALSQRNCGSMGYLNEQISLDNKRGETLDAIEEHTQRAITNPQRAVEGIITIPVVVHVIYSNASENISDAQIFSQIDVINEDFRRLNADADNTWSQAADSEIEFCLASVAPDGSATTGITRKSSTRTSWGTNDAMKSSSQGGVDAWNTSQYLNMWVCEIGGGILGYAQFPGGSSATDGVVMGPQYFGRVGNVSAPFNLGRTTTHEIGHWLNLRHIWGDGNCNADDFVSDTPTSDAANYGCATGHVSCNTTDMVENYMDYSDDACMNLYTAGQVARMRALFEPGGFRASLLSSPGCSGGADPTCDDGIQNQGEEGVDCGGPCAAVCPTCNDGEQNQGEEGVDCGGPCAAICPCEGNAIVVSITLDNYPEETSWTITDAGGATVASGGTYGSQADGSTVTINECLPDGCYDFTISDAYGDGICCSYGNGSYTVTGESGVLASGGSFASSETTNFCFDGGPSCTPGASCDDGDACTTGDVYDANCGCAGTFADSDGDGVCDAEDQCNGPEPGSACDDNDPNTDNDTVQADCSCAGTPTGGGGCTDVTVDSNDFEGGWGIWNDGGSDVRRSANDAAYANSGSYCVRLRDNSGAASSMTSDALNLTSYEEITISYSMYARSMENNEDYFIEMDRGNGYEVLANYARGVHFDNDTRYSDAITVAGPFSASTTIRFRCDASGNSDYVYIDDVVIDGCVNNGRGMEPGTIAESAREINATDFDFISAVNLYPNPTSNMLNIEYNVNKATEMTIMVTDITGKVMETRSMTVAEGTQQEALNASSFGSGFYFVHLISGNTKVSKKFVVVQ